MYQKIDQVTDCSRWRKTGCYFWAERELFVLVRSKLPETTARHQNFELILAASASAEWYEVKS